MLSSCQFSRQEIPLPSSLFVFTPAPAKVFQDSCERNLCSLKRIGFEMDFCLSLAAKNMKTRTMRDATPPPMTWNWAPEGRGGDLAVSSPDVFQIPRGASLLLRICVFATSQTNSFDLKKTSFLHDCAKLRNAIHTFFCETVFPSFPGRP